MRGSKKIVGILRSWKFHALLCLALAVIALVVHFSEKELLYEGISFGALIDSQAPEDFYKAQKATEALGAKAVRLLLQKLEEPTDFQKLYAEIYPKFPRMISEALPAPTKNHDQRRARAAALLSKATSNSIPAIPTLIRIAETDPHIGARWNSLCALADLAPNTEFEERSLAAVIKATKDDDRYIRIHSLALMGRFTNCGEKAHPILMEGLKSSETREMASRALRRLGVDDRAHMTDEEFERDLRLRKLSAN